MPDAHGSPTFAEQCAFNAQPSTLEICNDPADLADHAILELESAIRHLKTIRGQVGDGQEYSRRWALGNMLGAMDCVKAAAKPLSWEA